MRVLALDTTTRAGSVAVVADGQVLVERPGDEARPYAERLPAELLDALAAAGMTSADIDLFVVASGPGSFTGLRVGIATMQGLALVHGRPVASISALRALAEAAAAGHGAGTRVAGCMDAYRKDVFTAVYDVATPADADGVSTLTAVEEPMVDLPAATVDRWTMIGMPLAVCGDGVPLCDALWPSSTQVVRVPMLAGILGRLACARADSVVIVPPAGAQPLYVRRPDVEVKREADAARS
jgi:tRNA threonylcarbamoyladenosine biosynthesis protein TsaB